MNLLKRTILLGSLSAATLVTVPAVASADVGGYPIPPEAQFGSFSYTTEIIGDHLYFYITTPTGTYVIDPPVIVS